MEVTKNRIFLHIGSHKHVEFKCFLEAILICFILVCFITLCLTEPFLCCCGKSKIDKKKKTVRQKLIIYGPINC